MTPLNVAAIVYAVVAFLSMCAVFLFIILGIIAVTDASLIEEGSTVDTGQKLVIIIGAFFIALVLGAIWPASTAAICMAALETHWREKEEIHSE